MRVLITGHRGFVGRHFRQRLEAEGHEVYGADIADPERPTDCRVGFMADQWRDIDLVIHAAATIPPIDQRSACDLIVANDFSIDAEMWQWAMRTRPRKIVYFSSSAAYPVALQTTAHRLREDELDLLCPASPDAMYGMTKLVGELQAREARRLGMDVLVLRPFSGYGEDQDQDYPFRAFIERATRRESMFDVWGDGTQVRDFIHIDDIVEATMMMVDAGFIGPVNMGTGIPTSLLALAKMVIAEMNGYQPAIRLVGTKPTGAIYRCCEPSLLHSVYVPKIGLQEGIQRALVTA